MHFPLQKPLRKMRKGARRMRAPPARPPLSLPSNTIEAMLTRG